MKKYLKNWWFIFVLRNIHSYAYMYFRFTSQKIAGFTLYVDRLNDKNYIVLPYPGLMTTDINQLRNLCNGYLRHLEKKYLIGGLQVNEIDCVIDCGSFCGGFAIYAAKSNVKRVLAFEPTPRSMCCAKINSALYSVDNIRFREVALGSREGIVELFESATQTDNSVGNPDQLATGHKIAIQMVRLDSVILEEELDMQHTLLKLEAEGFELDVISGLGDYRPKYISVDITEGGLRDGLLNSTITDMGYTLESATNRVHLYKAGNKKAQC